MAKTLHGNLREVPPNARKHELAEVPSVLEKTTTWGEWAYPCHMGISLDNPIFHIESPND